MLQSGAITLSKDFRENRYEGIQGRSKSVLSEGEEEAQESVAETVVKSVVSEPWGSLVQREARVTKSAGNTVICRNLRQSAPNRPKL